MNYSCKYMSFFEKSRNRLHFHSLIHTFYFVESTLARKKIQINLVFHSLIRTFVTSKKE